MPAKQLPLIRPSLPLLEAWNDLQRATSKDRPAVLAHFKQLQIRALAAISNYRAALHDSEREPIALARYQARIRMATSWQVLRALVGDDEATAVLRNRQQRPWLRG